MNLEGQVRERNLNPKNACLKRRPELPEGLGDAFQQAATAMAAAEQAGRGDPQVCSLYLINKYNILYV